MLRPRLLIKFPSRSRPGKFFDCLDNIKSLIGIEDYIIAAALDLDDATMNNPDVKQRLRSYDNLIIYWGVSKSKIEAINRSIPTHFQWKYLLVTSDDMWFTQPNFGISIIQAFKLYPNAGLMHFPDQKQVDKLITLPILSREYYDQFGYVYHPSYVSVKADKEQMEVAKVLNKYQYINENIFEHRHPRWGWPKDELYDKWENQNIYAIDGTNFAKREVFKFGL